MALLEDACRRIAESGKVEWFGKRESAALCRILRHGSISVPELAMLAPMSTLQAKEALEALKARGIARASEGRYLVHKPLVCLSDLVSMCEQKKALQRERQAFCSSPQKTTVFP